MSLPKIKVSYVKDEVIEKKEPIEEPIIKEALVEKEALVDKAVQKEAVQKEAVVEDVEKKFIRYVELFIDISSKL